MAALHMKVSHQMSDSALQNAACQGKKPVLKLWVRMENTRAEGRFIFDVTPLMERQ
jgi:hypothetical protein